MQRKELEKAVEEYSHKIKFFKLGLIRQLIELKARRRKTLENAIPKIICPQCKSPKIGIESDDREYHFDYWLYCENCGVDFDDEYGYIDACNELESEAWFDTLEVIAHFEPERVTGDADWQKHCEKEISKMLKEGSDSMVVLI